MEGRERRQDTLKLLNCCTVIEKKDSEYIWKESTQERLILLQIKVLFSISVEIMCLCEEQRNIFSCMFISECKMSKREKNLLYFWCCFYVVLLLFKRLKKNSFISFRDSFLGLVEIENIHLFGNMVPWL